MKKQTSATTETQNKGRTIIDFSGKTLYIGIDVHQKDYQVAIVHETRCLGNHRMPASGEKLITHLNKHYPAADLRCVYEACSWGFVLQRKLSAEGIDCIVVNPADVATSDKERRRKTDKVDALKLAREHEAHHLQAIYVPEETSQKERNLIRFRKSVVKDLNRCKNRIKSLLKFQGIDIPEKFSKSTWCKNFVEWLEQEGNKDELIGDVLLARIAELKFHRGQLLDIERKVRKLMKTQKFIRSSQLAQSVVGFGANTAALFLLEIGDITRFKRFDSLNNLIGFCPDSHSSGENERQTGITTRRHSQLRTAFVEAAWTAIRIDPAMADAYSKLIKRMEGNKAIIRIARKLLRRLRAVLISGIPYQKGVIK
jgi:transposase